MICYCEARILQCGIEKVVEYTKMLIVVGHYKLALLTAIQYFSHLRICLQLLTTDRKENGNLQWLRLRLYADEFLPWLV